MADNRLNTAEMVSEDDSFPSSVQILAKHAYRNDWLMSFEELDEDDLTNAEYFIRLSRDVWSIYFKYDRKGSRLDSYMKRSLLGEKDIYEQMAELGELIEIEEDIEI